MTLRQGDTAPGAKAPRLLSTLLCTRDEGPQLAISVLGTRNTLVFRRYSAFERPPEVQRFTVVDKLDFSPSPLTVHSDTLYSKEALPVSYFKWRGSLWPSMCTCICSWSFSSSVWLCFGIFAGSLVGLPPPVGGPSAARCTVCSSRALHVIVRLVAFPPVSQQVLVHRLGRCGPGAR